MMDILSSNSARRDVGKQATKKVPEEGLQTSRVQVSRRVFVRAK
jgi:hypothetical protein